MLEPTTLSGTFVGYDPGGDKKHGIAEMRIENGSVVSLVTKTLGTTEDVIAYTESLPALVGLGVDTLTCWSTGQGGWRPADRYLRRRYEGVRNSVVTPNGMFGSMGLNGMAFLVAMRRRYPGVPVTETHPKVLHWHLYGKPHDHSARKREMNEDLGLLIGKRTDPTDEHQWDAATSAYAAFKGLAGHWPQDLHTHELAKGERLIMPCGMTNYFWPE